MSKLSLLILIFLSPICLKCPAQNSKIETVASQEVITKTQNTLDSLRNVVNLKSGISVPVGYLGVLVNTNESNYYNGYDKLNIFMDCEDNGNFTNQFNQAIRNEYAYSWTHCPIDVSASGDITMAFFLVPEMYFSELLYRGSKYGFAVFNGLTNSDYPVSLNFIERYFDNQDNGNDNSVTLNDEKITGPFRHSYFNKNTLLSLVYFPPTESGVTSLPYIPGIGYDYYVFGKFGPNQSYLSIDDEDGGNANSMKVYESNLKFMTHTVSKPNKIPWIINGGGNTGLCISKASNMRD